MTNGKLKPLEGRQIRRFSQMILAWHRRHGRTDLPWQESKDPYRVWLSEIMLQQTRVATVIPYYNRFVKRFPTVQSLAEAEVDEVMQLWSGLGYYARARNLHQTAHRIIADHGGHFPDTLEAMMALPGIGRSTAGAILAFSHGQRTPILDGNVRRVLTRYLALAGDPGESGISRILWEQAATLTPSRDVGRYTQAIMDLGATVCTRNNPDCANCPLSADCRAFAEGDSTDYPTPGRKRARPVRDILLLLIGDPEGRILLERRPDRGIWGGLWSLPEAPVDDPSPTCPIPKGTLDPLPGNDVPPIHQDFTHFRLQMHPRRFRILPETVAIPDSSTHLWYDPADPLSVGLPTAISRLLTLVQTIPEARNDKNGTLCEA